MRKTHAFIKMALVFSVMSAALGLTACSGAKGEAKTQNVTDEFKNIQVVTNTADVTFLPTENGECKVVCIEHKKITHAANVTDGTLKIEVSDKRSWFEKLFTPKMSVTVYLPKSDYSTLTVGSDTGDLEIKDGFKFGAIDISSDTGDMEIEAITCNSLTAKLDTGDISLDSVTSEGRISVTTDTGEVELEKCKAGEIYVKTSTGDVDIDGASCTILAATVSTGEITLENVIADGKFDIVSSTGDVKFTACDAASVFITTSTGDVRGSFLTEKIVFADTDTGRVDIPKLTSGGKCEITTKTGDIKVTIVK